MGIAVEAQTQEVSSRASSFISEMRRRYVEVFIVTAALTVS